MSFARKSLSAATDVRTSRTSDRTTTQVRDVNTKPSIEVPLRQKEMLACSDLFVSYKPLRSWHKTAGRWSRVRSLPGYLIRQSRWWLALKWGWGVNLVSGGNQVMSQPSSFSSTLCCFSPLYLAKINCRTVTLFSKSAYLHSDSSSVGTHPESTTNLDI